MCHLVLSILSKRKSLDGESGASCLPGVLLKANKATVARYFIKQESIRGTFTVWSFSARHPEKEGCSPHFTYGETEAQETKMLFPREVGEPGAGVCARQVGGGVEP